ncbi:hypothetical protein DOCECA_26120 [Pseudomonas sp. E102]
MTCARGSPATIGSCNCTELPGELTLSVAHGISDQAADAIQRAYPKAEVLVHADPSEVVKRASA